MLLGLSNFHLKTQNGEAISLQQNNKANGNGLNNNQELSPLFKKAELQILIGNIGSPNQNNMATNGGNWSANPSVGPSPVDDQNEAQSFSSLAKIWQKANNQQDSNSRCHSNDASPMLYGKNQAGQDMHANFTNLANATKNSQFVGSEHSAFRRGSPRMMQGQSLVSEMNTPRLENQKNIKKTIQNRKSSFANQSKYGNTSSVHTLASSNMGSR